MPSSRSSQSLFRTARTAAAVTAAAVTVMTAVAVTTAGAAAATPPPGTTHSPARGAAGWLAQQFGDHFVAYGSFDGGTTADAIFALAAAGVGDTKIHAAIGYLARHVNQYTNVKDTSGKPGPYDGSVAKAAVAAMVAGADPTHFGGYNLLRALKTDQCTTASAPKNNHDYTTPTCPAPGAARNSYSGISESFAVLAEARGAKAYGSSYAPDAAALQYFLSLQCPDGGFTAGTSGGTNCAPDPDATGYAMMALEATGNHHDALAKAARWLTGARNADGSWTAQHVHNVDSTGIAAAALNGYGADTSRSSAWLAGQQVTTGPSVGARATRGALKYRGRFDRSASVKATADGVLGMVAHGSLATLSAARATAGTPVLSLAHTGRDSRQTVAELAVGLALVVGGAGLLAAGRRRIRQR